ncbi:MAG: ribbon-helix-helix domain-containing protein [Methyloceanibacter sp.]
MFARPHPSYAKRKLIEFAPEIWLALEMLAKDTGRNVQELADEAFADLLGKYQRPASLKDALRESTRRLPANDDTPPTR